MPNPNPTRRISVRIIAQVVSSDGHPVGGNGEEYGPDWKSNWEWVTRRVSVNRFCPKSVAQESLRMVFYRRYPSDPEVVKCRCHGKWRLVNNVALAEAEGGAAA